MSYYIDFFSPSTDYLRLVGIARLGVALAEYDFRKSPAAISGITWNHAPSSKEGYIEQLALLVYPPFMKNINLRIAPGDYSWVQGCVDTLEKDRLIVWAEQDDTWILKRTKRGNLALNPEPPPVTITDVGTAIRYVVQLTYCIKHDPTIRGDPRSLGASLTPKGLLDWLTGFGVEIGTARKAIFESCTQGLILAMPGDFTSFGFEFDHRYTITSDGESFLGKNMEGGETNLDSLSGTHLTVR